MALLVLSGAVLVGAGFLFFSWYKTLFSTEGIPTVPTFKEHQQLFLKNINLVSGASLIDFGCGTGAMLRFLSRHYSKVNFFGIDLNRTALWWARWKNKHGKYTRVSCAYGNIFQQDIQQYDYIYCYLFPFLMEKVETFLEKNMNKNTIVIAMAFPLPNWTPFRVIKNEKGVDKIFLYQRK